MPSVEAPTTLSGVIDRIIDAHSRVDREQFLPRYYTFYDHLYQNGCMVGTTVCGCNAGVVAAVDIFEYGGGGVRGWSDFMATNSAWEAFSKAADWIRVGNYDCAADALGIDERGNELLDLPEPKFQDYDSWLEFDRHVESLEGISPLLKEMGL